MSLGRIFKSAFLHIQCILSLSSKANPPFFPWEVEVLLPREGCTTEYEIGKRIEEKKSPASIGNQTQDLSIGSLICCHLSYHHSQCLSYPYIEDFLVKVGGIKSEVTDASIIKHLFLLRNAGVRSGTRTDRLSI